MWSVAVINHDGGKLATASKDEDGKNLGSCRRPRVIGFVRPSGVS